MPLPDDDMSATEIKETERFATFGLFRFRERNYLFFTVWFVPS